MVDIFVWKTNCAVCVCVVLAGKKERRERMRMQQRSVSLTMQGNGKEGLNGKLCRNNWQIILESFKCKLMIKFMICSDLKIQEMMK